MGSPRSLLHESGFSTDDTILGTWRDHFHDAAIKLGTSHKVHKAILSLGPRGSVVLNEMWSKEQDFDSSCRFVELDLSESLPPECWPLWDSVLNFCYYLTESVPLDAENIMKYVAIGHSLKMSALIVQCASYVRQNLTWPNAFQWLQDMAQLKCIPVDCRIVQALDWIVTANLVIIPPEKWGELPCSCLCRLLLHERVRASREMIGTVVASIVRKAAHLEPNEALDYAECVRDGAMLKDALFLLSQCCKLGVEPCPRAEGCMLTLARHFTEITAEMIEDLSVATIVSLVRRHDLELSSELDVLHLLASLVTINQRKDVPFSEEELIGLWKECRFDLLTPQQQRAAKRLPGVTEVLTMASRRRAPGIKRVGSKRIMRLCAKYPSHRDGSIEAVVGSMLLSAKNECLYVMLRDGFVKAYNPNSLELIPDMEWHAHAMDFGEWPAEVAGVFKYPMFLTEGEDELVTVGSHDVCVWDLAEPGSCVWHMDAPFTLSIGACSPVESIVTCHARETDDAHTVLRVWDRKTQKCRQTTTVVGLVDKICFSPDSKTELYLFPTFDHIQVWSTRTSTVVREIPTECRGRVNAVVFTSDSKRMAVGEETGRVMVIFLLLALSDLPQIVGLRRGGELEHEFTREAAVAALQLNADALLFVGLFNGIVEVWDIHFPHSSACVHSIRPDHFVRLYDTAVSSDGQSLLLARQFDSSRFSQQYWHLYDPKAGGDVWKLEVGGKRTGITFAAAVDLIPQKVRLVAGERH